MKYTSIILIIALAVIAAGYGVLSRLDSTPKAGGYLSASVVATSTAVNMVDTLVLNPSTATQYFYAINTGAGNIDCTWTTTSTLTGAAVGTGLRFEATTFTTSTEKAHEITNPTLLGKYMHCIANTTSSLGVLRYSNY
jgi:hypothetical protein